MKFRFIHSKKGYGKTNYIFDDIKNSIQSNIVIFVPSHSTFDIENRLINYFGEQIFLRVEIMDFKKLTSKILNKYKKFKLQRISDIGKNLLINYVLKSVEKELVYFKSKNWMNLSDDILSVLIDFKSFNVKYSDIEKILCRLDKNNEFYRKLKDFITINDRYESFINQKYLDPLDDMTIANSIIKNNKEIFNGYKFYIDGFEILTYHQYEFLKIILNRASEVNLSLTFDNSNNLIYSHTRNIKNKVLNILFEKGCFDIEDIFLDNSAKNIELKHLDDNYLKYKYQVYNKPCINICINKCINNFHEVEELCKEIRNLILEKGYRYREIGVICRDIEYYESFIKVYFEEFKIPYFIDKKNDIRSNIFVIFLTSIFDIFNYNFSYGSLFKYMKSGLVNIDKEDIFLLENFAIENGINGYKWTKKFTESSKIKYAMSGRRNNLNIDIEYIEELRIKIVVPLIKLFSYVKEDHSVSYFIVKICEFLDENSVLEKIKDICNDFRNEGHFAYVDQINQTVNAIFTIFDEMNDIFKDEIISFSDFGEILTSSFLKIEISQVPMRLDEVIIGDVTRLMVGRYKALFVICCTSTNFPKIHKTEGLLSDFEKQYFNYIGLELPGTNMDKNSSERYLTYSSLNIPTEFLYISYPISSMDGTSLSPSIIISRIKKIFPQIIEKNNSNIFREFSLNDISSERETLNNIFLKMRDNLEFNEIFLDVCKFYGNDKKYRKYINLFLKKINETNYCTNLSQNVVDYVYKNMKFSISAIETYSKCPFKYFIDYLIKANKRKIYSFDVMDCGNLVHFLMEKICKSISTSYDFKNICDLDIIEIIDSYFKKNIFCDNNLNYIVNSSLKFRVFGNKIKKIVSNSIIFVAKHSSESEFFHKFYEFEIGNENSKIEIKISENRKVQFSGKIDRVDFCKVKNNIFINIVDYKSGVKIFDYGKVYQNLNIQTIAYMKYIMKICNDFYDENIIPCGIFYFTLHSRNIKDKDELDLLKEVCKNYRYEGIFTSDIKVLSLIDKNLLRNLSSNILPIKLKKDRSFYKNDSSDRLLNESEFNDILNFVDYSIKCKLREIFQGNIDVYPVLDNKFSNKCLNCDYIGVCKFSKDINKFRVVIDLRKDEFFNLIKRGSSCEMEFESK